MSDRIETIRRTNPFLARKHEILAMVSTALDQMAFQIEAGSEGGPLADMAKLRIDLKAQMTSPKGYSFELCCSPELDERTFDNAPFRERVGYSGATVVAGETPDEG